MSQNIRASFLPCKKHLELQNQSQFVLNSIKLHRQLESKLESLALSAREKATLFHKANFYSSRFKVSADVFYTFAIGYFSKVENATVSLIETFLREYLFHVEYVVAGVICIQ